MRSAVTEIARRAVEVTTADGREALQRDSGFGRRRTYTPAVRYMYVRTASDASETHPMFKPPKVLTTAEGRQALASKTRTASETRTLN